MKYHTQRIVKKSQHWHLHGKHGHLHGVMMEIRKLYTFNHRALQGWCDSIRDLIK